MRGNLKSGSNLQTPDEAANPLNQYTRLYSQEAVSRDQRFNHVGGIFRSAITVRTNQHGIDLPEKSADLKRFNQKSLQGNVLDQKPSYFDPGSFMYTIQETKRP